MVSRHLLRGLLALFGSLILGVSCTFASPPGLPDRSLPVCEPGVPTPTPALPTRNGIDDLLTQELEPEPGFIETLELFMDWARTGFDPSYSFLCPFFGVFPPKSNEQLLHELKHPNGKYAGWMNDQPSHLTPEHLDGGIGPESAAPKQTDDAKVGQVAGLWNGLWLLLPSMDLPLLDRDGLHWPMFRRSGKQINGDGIDQQPGLPGEPIAPALSPSVQNNPNLGQSQQVRFFHFQPNGFLTGLQHPGVFTTDLDIPIHPSLLQVGVNTDAGLTGSVKMTEKEKDQKVAELLEQFNNYYKECKDEEAERVAKEAHELDPESAAAQAIYQIARMRTRMVEQKHEHGQIEEFNYGDLMGSPDPNDPSELKKQELIRDIEFQRLRHLGHEAQSQAVKLFQDGDSEHALEILNDFKVRLLRSDLSAEKLALLCHPINDRIQKFNTVIRLMEDEKQCEENKKTAAELMKQSDFLNSEGRFREADPDPHHQQDCFINRFEPRGFLSGLQLPGAFTTDLDIPIQHLGIRVSDSGDLITFPIADDAAVDRSVNTASIVQTVVQAIVQQAQDTVEQRVLSRGLQSDAGLTGSVMLEDNVKRMRELDLHGLHVVSREVQSRAVKLFQEGDHERALETLAELRSRLSKANLSADKLALLCLPVDDCIEKFNSAIALLETKRKCERDNEKTAEAWKQFESLSSEGKYKEAGAILAKNPRLNYLPSAVPLDAYQLAVLARWRAADGQNPDLLQDQVDELLESFHQHLWREQFDQAEQDATKALTLDPGNKTAKHALAILQRLRPIDAPPRKPVSMQPALPPVDPGVVQALEKIQIGQEERK